MMTSWWPLFKRTDFLSFPKMQCNPFLFIFIFFSVEIEGYLWFCFLYFSVWDLVGIASTIVRDSNDQKNPIFCIGSIEMPVDKFVPPESDTCLLGAYKCQTESCS